MSVKVSKEVELADPDGPEMREVMVVVMICWVSLLLRVELEGVALAETFVDVDAVDDWATVSGAISAPRSSPR